MRKYWTLKTRSDEYIDPNTGEPREHWENFVREGVVAIGWMLSPELRQRNTNLEDITFQELEKDLLKTSYDRTAKAIQAASKILKFIREVGIGNGILLCRGYAAKQQPGVHIYGFAKVKGRAWYDNHSAWWFLKRKADIWPVEAEIPRPELADVLNKGSLRHTIHEVSEDSFRQVCERLNFTLPTDC